ncbi:MAG: ABC transporter substrate-binding protein [Acidobacteria bacterium]|nr:ABC transporter substrate-binding protein [Acidobacteriota bacterium]
MSKSRNAHEDTLRLVGLRRGRAALLGTGLVALLLFLWFGGTHSAQGAKRIPYGGVLRAALQAEVKTLDPVLANNLAEWQLSSLIFDRLVLYDAKGDLRPSLAVEWTSHNNATQWDFLLQKNAKFHDGSPLTAVDIKKSFERLILNQKNPIGKFLAKRLKGAEDYLRGSGSDVAGLVIQNPRLLSFQTNTPQPALPEILALLPCSIVKLLPPNAGLENNGRRGLYELLGSGPFTLAPRHEKGRILLRAFAEHFSGPPYLDRIEITAKKAGQSPAALFRLGKLDLLDLAVADRGSLEREKLGTLVVNPRSTSLLLGVNATLPLFKRVEAREAIARAIDRNIILRVLLKSDGQLATGIIPPELGDFAALREKPIYQADLAERMFSANGATIGERTITVITRSQDDYAQPIAQRIAVNLRDLGLRAQAEPLSADEFDARRQSRKFDLFLDGFPMPALDSALNLRVFLMQYSDMMTPERAAEADALISRAELLTDYDERNRLLYQAEKQLLDDYSVIPIFHLKSALLAGGNLANLWIDYLGILRLEDTWRKDER